MRHPRFEAGLWAVACTNCQSVSRLELQDNQVRCRDCNTTYKIIDGVLDLMPPSYSGFQGDSMEAAALRDAHNRQSLDKLTDPKPKSYSSLGGAFQWADCSA